MLGPQGALAVYALEAAVELDIVADLQAGADSG